MSHHSDSGGFPDVFIIRRCWTYQPSRNCLLCSTRSARRKTKRLPPRTLACWTLDESLLGKIAQASWDRTMPSLLSCWPEPRMLALTGRPSCSWSTRAANHNVSPMGQPRPFIMELSRSPRHLQGRHEICSCPYPVPPGTDDCVESAAVHSGRGIHSIIRIRYAVPVAVFKIHEGCRSLSRIEGQGTSSSQGSKG